MTKQQILELRNEGKTYAEIGKIFGVSRQRVHQVVGTERVRKCNCDIERIKYKGLYEFMQENPTVTFFVLAREMQSGGSRNYYEKFRNFATGKTESSYFSINQIKRLIEFTGKSFEELFEERELQND